MMAVTMVAMPRARTSKGWKTRFISRPMKMPAKTRIGATSRATWVLDPSAIWRPSSICPFRASTTAAACSAALPVAAAMAEDGEADGPEEDGGQPQRLGGRGCRVHQQLRFHRHPHGGRAEHEQRP